MKQNEKQQFLQTWEKTRKRGILVYALATALSWGTVVAVVVQLVYLFLEDMFSLDALKSAFMSQEFLRQWGVFLLGGLFYGITLWFYFGWRYRQLKVAEGQGNEANAPHDGDVNSNRPNQPG